MSDQEKSLISQVQTVADWTVEDRYRWIGLWVIVLASQTTVMAVAVRYSWRIGAADPSSRLQYALVETFANLPGAIGFGIVGLLVYGIIRKELRDADD